MPGLIDAYTNAGLPGGAAESTAEITPAVRVLPTLDWEHRQFSRALASGVTTVLVAPNSDNVVSGLAAVVKTAGDSAAARTVKPDAAMMISFSSDPRGGGGRNRSGGRPDTIYTRQPTNRMGVVWTFRHFMQTLKNDGEVEPGLMPDALAGRIPLLSVSRTHYDLDTIVRLGEEFNFKAVAVGGEEAYKVSDRLAASQTPVILGPLRTTAGNGPEGTSLVLNNAGALHKAGVAFAISGGNLLEQALFAHRFGLPAEAALAAIARAPAELLRVQDRVGSIAVGRDADLLALSGDPLSPTTSIRWVMVDGVIRREMKD
jgi:imidazolonepropionase-like amidohydrolase